VPPPPPTTTVTSNTDSLIQVSAILPISETSQTGSTTTTTTTSNSNSTSTNNNTNSNIAAGVNNKAILDHTQTMNNEQPSLTNQTTTATTTTTSAATTISPHVSIGNSSSSSSSSSSTTVAAANSNSTSINVSNGNRLDTVTPPNNANSQTTTTIANTNSDYLLNNKLNELNAAINNGSSLPQSNTTTNHTNLTGSMIATPTSSITSSIPQPIQSNNTNNNRFTTSLSTTAATTNTSNKPHQRGITSLVTTSGPQATSISGSNTVKLKKSDTGRGTLDFPKSASTDKSRIESFLNRNVPNSSIQDSNTIDPLRTTHSYRTKGELMQNSLNQQQQQQQQSAAAAANVGAASMLTSLTTQPNSAVKSLSAAPIKPNDNSNLNGSSVATKSELRPRLVEIILFSYIRIYYYIIICLFMFFVKSLFPELYSFMLYISILKA
jgi:hypothetical protein